MSFTRRFINSARDGLNSIVDKVAADDTPLSHVSEGDLQAELQDRVKARKSANRDPGANPIARMAGASDAARKAREQAANKREGRILGARRRREKVEREAHERAFRDAQAQAKRQASKKRPTGSTNRRRRRRQGFPFQPKNSKLDAAFKQLEVERDASMADVKKQFRKLMRKFHPDRHAGNPKKQKAATELTMRITSAYHTIDEHMSKNK